MASGADGVFAMPRAVLYGGFIDISIHVTCVENLASPIGFAERKFVRVQIVLATWKPEMYELL